MAATIKAKTKASVTLEVTVLKGLCDAVGAAAQAKEEGWADALPALAAPVKSAGAGLDGPCTLLTESGWREARGHHRSLRQPWSE